MDLISAQMNGVLLSVMWQSGWVESLGENVYMFMHG